MTNFQATGVVLFIGPLLASDIALLAGKPREEEEVELVESA